MAAVLSRGEIFDFDKALTLLFSWCREMLARV